MESILAPSSLSERSRCLESILGVAKQPSTAQLRQEGSLEHLEQMVD